jgi:hypothetical protein
MWFLFKRRTVVDAEYYRKEIEKLDSQLKESQSRSEIIRLKNSRDEMMNRYRKILYREK